MFYLQNNNKKKKKNIFYYLEHDLTSCHYVLSYIRWSFFQEKNTQNFGINAFRQ